MWKKQLISDGETLETSHLSRASSSTGSRGQRGAVTVVRRRGAGEPLMGTKA